MRERERERQIDRQRQRGEMRTIKERKCQVKLTITTSKRSAKEIRMDNQ